MSFFTILESLLIGPLKLVFELIYSLAYRLIDNPGPAIVVLSLAINILVLPLYRQADAMQEEAKNTEARLHDAVAHIKKSFSGDERMMILQTFYRQNHYSPLSALNGSVSLLLEIPFFMAAYQFLSDLELLSQVSMGPIADLSLPDGILVLGGMTINLLPIAMTVINLISSALYLKGSPLKTKIQLYAMALFFLVFLYDSPSGLVFYWTLNNLFSLVKTIFYKLKNPRKVISLLSSVSGILLLIYTLFFYDAISLKRELFLVALCIVLQVPAILSLILAKLPPPAVPRPNGKLFLVNSLVLTLLVGALIPSAFLAASPQEYVDIAYFYHPLWYLASTLALAAGTFLVWMRVFYWLASPGGKVLFDRITCILCGITLVNYMFFGTDLGIISSALRYENGVSFSVTEMALNLLVLAVVSGILYVLCTKQHRIMVPALLTVAIALGGMALLNTMTVQDSISQLDPSTVAGNALDMDANSDQDMPSFRLSKTGKNVIVLMLDRAKGEYLPYLLQEKPELKEQFDGFTYYSNTVSFGGYTIFATPALLGGYEYTPVEMNRRSGEPLADKHDEALKVMPTLFLENGYEVTVCDPVYARHQWIPDLSIYEDTPEIKAYNTKGRFGSIRQKELAVESNLRNFFLFSLMKSAPLFTQTVLYDNGHYHQFESTELVTCQVESISTSTGISQAFEEPYNVLLNLTEMTEITEEDTGTFLFLSNDTTHEPALLQTPDYTPALSVDNTQYDAEHSDRFTLDGKTLKVEDPNHMSHYHVNMAALLRLGQWFDYLRENGVYDNTKIIVVADHGRDLMQMEELIADTPYGQQDLALFAPLLLVKDFGASGFETSQEFMTNADVPVLAMEDTIENPRNPFTGNPIDSSEKTAHDQFVILSSAWTVQENSGNTFIASQWASVKDDLWNKSNWTFYEGTTVLAEHAAP